MDWHKITALDEVRGRASLQRARDPEAVERAQYIHTLQSWGH